MPKTKSSHLFLNIIIVGVAYVGINFLFLGELQLCMWRALFGLPCPGCGLSHAALFLFQGKLRESLFWHPLLIPLFITVFFSLFPAGRWKVADFVNRQHWWQVLLCVSFFVLYVIRWIVCFPQETGPMFYDKANYLYLLWNSLLHIF